MKTTWCLLVGLSWGCQVVGMETDQHGHFWLSGLFMGMALTLALGAIVRAHARYRGRSTITNHVAAGPNERHPELH